MALTNNGTVNNLPADQLPTGYTRPTVTTFTDYQWTYRVTLSVLKSTVEDATPSTTMTNIIDNGTIGITKQITDIVAADFLTAPTTTYYTDWVGLSHNLSDLATVSDDVLDNVALSYQCTVQVYLKN
jgi:hypothetical protein